MAVIISEVSEKIYLSVLRTLSPKDLTNKEANDIVARNIKKTGLSEKNGALVKEFILKRLWEENFVNDDRYTKMFVDSIVSSSRPRGKFYIKRFLEKKGIAGDTVEKALQGIDSEKETQGALELAQKKLGSLKPSEPAARKRQKIWAFLIRKGFSSNTAKDAVDRVLGVK